MLVVRDIFTARPGKASELAKLFTSINQEMRMGNARVLTDFVSTHNTVVIEIEVEDLSALEHAMKDRDKYSARLKAANYTELFYTGRREILQVMGR
jgi:hypothetical protein